MMPFARMNVLNRLPLRHLAAALLVPTLLLSGCATTSTPQLWDHWTTHDERERQPLDVTLWREFLHTYVVRDADGVERVAYARVSPEARERLEGWLRVQQQQRPSSLNLREQRAYWLNLYNAAVVHQVLAHTPIVSLASLEPMPWKAQASQWGSAIHIPGAKDWAPPGPFAEPLLKIEGQTLSLNDIENHILRPRWRDARTDYALCKATLSGPALAAEPYTAEYLDEQLDARANAWVNSPQALRFTPTGQLEVADFYRQYQADFGDDAAILTELRHRAAPSLAAKLANVKSISGTFSDQRLNEAGGSH